MYCHILYAHISMICVYKLCEWVYQSCVIRLLVRWYVLTKLVGLPSADDL